MYEDEGTDEVWQPGGEQHHRHHQQVRGPPRLADTETVGYNIISTSYCRLGDFVSFCLIFVFLDRCRRMTA